eukprot:TRINITY_DN39248_c0_g1_i3.p1 TRINITY_DN39248_c0_g1~~TRINITY_DN39248_c0_g1_i3.p1  ORF type:complete len:236 (-),score=56.69 TRINITY_DN39248_c0_g1_i3:233-940(-)
MCIRDREYDVDSLDMVVEALQCDVCRATMKMIWSISRDGPRNERGVATQVFKAHEKKHWRQGPDAIVDIIQRICKVETLPQRYVGLKRGQKYHLLPLVNVDGKLDSTRAGSAIMVGGSGKEITDGVDEEANIADTSTRPKYAMSVICHKIVKKADLYELAEKVYKLHASAFGASGPAQYNRLEQDVCVEATGCCTSLDADPPWTKPIFRPAEGSEPVGATLTGEQLMAMKNKGEL